MASLAILWSRLVVYKVCSIKRSINAKIKLYIHLPLPIVLLLQFNEISRRIRLCVVCGITKTKYLN